MELCDTSRKLLAKVVRRLSLRRTNGKKEVTMTAALSSQISPPLTTINSLPIELIEQVFFQLLAEDEEYCRQKLGPDEIMEAPWRGNDHPRALVCHPYRRFFSSKDARESARAARGRVRSFTAVCRTWRTIGTSFHAQVLSIELQANQSIAFDAPQDLRCVKHIELAICSGDAFPRLVDTETLYSTVALVAESLSCISVDPRSISWLQDLVSLLPRAHEQLKQLRIFLHDSHMEEKQQIAPDVWELVGLCRRLERVDVSRHASPAKVEATLVCLLALPHIRHLKLLNCQRSAELPLPIPKGLVANSIALQTLHLYNSGYTLLDSVIIAGMFADFLRDLILTVSNFNLPIADLNLSMPSTLRFPRLEYVCLEATFLDDIEADAHETNVSLELLDGAHRLTHIELRHLLFLESTTPPSSTSGAVEQLVAKVGNGVVQKVNIVSEEKKRKRIPEAMRTMLEKERPQSWIDNKVEVFLNLD